MESEEITMENNTIYRPGDTGNGGSRTALDTMGQSAPPLVQQAQQQAGQMIDQARTQVMSQLATQKDQAAGSIGRVAEALRQTGQQLRGQHQDAFAPYAESAADYVERFSRSLQERDIQEMIDGVERFARREPAMFVGGALALGFLAARFLKSSRPNVTLNDVKVSPDYSGARGAREYASSGPFTGPAHDLAAMRAPEVIRPTAGSASSSAAPSAGPGYGAATAPGDAAAATNIDAADRVLAAPAGTGVRSSDDE
jgi:hypothetical protein